MTLRRHWSWLLPLLVAFAIAAYPVAFLAMILLYGRP